MSGHQYFSNGNSLFSDDVDDETFLKNARVKPKDDYLEQRQLYEQKRKEIENRTLDSSQRSIGLLRETEQVGIATAQELLKQREQLENTRDQLDTINTSLKFSQRHLTGIKSMFGGLKNYLSGKSEFEPSKMSPSSSNSSSIASPTADERYSQHPTTRLRNDPQMQQKQQMAGNVNFNQQLDRNLDEMCDSLSRLKGLAIDLNGEIDSQNDLIDQITDKTEDVDIKIGKQNQQMFKILGKK
ncbi:synaptosomal-associated protein 29 [Chironomus tepperi]|uniref:synaptosomal-associated protein 29 n=1 Tax=Chironomus tepperi TaxID=113505 RepID=UPI00391F43F7